jgi:hypothetical protein
VIDVAENAKPEFRILVEDFPLGDIFTKMSGNKSIVFEDVLDEGADLLASFGPGIVRQYTVTRSGELFESVPDQPTPSVGVMLRKHGLSS